MNQTGYPEAFKAFAFERGSIDPQVIRTRVGSVQRREFDAGVAADQRVQDQFLFDFYCAETVLTDNAGVFEWLDICETVLAANGRYTFVELGAGYARWAVIAYFLARRFRGLPTTLVCVEPEPTHYRWVLQNLRDNGIRPRDHVVLEGAVAERDGYVFVSDRGDPSANYGQSIVGPLRPSLWGRMLLEVRPVWRRMKSGKASARQDKTCVKAHSLASLLDRVEIADLIHIDVQGSEHDILSTAIGAINEKAKRLHVGTHTPAIEVRLRKLLGSNGWTCIRDHPQGRSVTEFGEMDFEDGIQTWINSRLAR